MSEHRPRHTAYRLLVVTADDRRRDWVCRQLQDEGYAVSTAGDAAQALVQLQGGDFDLILSDGALLELEGASLLQGIGSDNRLANISVITLGWDDESESTTKYIEMGAVDYLPGGFGPVLLKARVARWLDYQHLRYEAETYRLQLKAEQQRSDALVHVVIPIGVALSAEKDFDRLLEMILVEAKSFCNADGGTLYLRTEDDFLKFVIMRNDSLDIALGGTTEKAIPYAPIPLYNEATGEPNHHNVATYAALKGASVNIVDAYEAEGFDFSGTKAFDQQTDYRSTSFLTIPLKNTRGYVIGVLQLLNAQDSETGQIIPFDPALQRMIEILAALATIALEAYIREQKLREQIQQLSIEIDEIKKAREVAEITESEYFKQLQARARHIRAQTRPRTSSGTATDDPQNAE